LYCATAVGGTAAAFTVRDTLFPALGAPTKRGVWATSNVDTTVSAQQHGSTTTMSRDVVILEAAMQQEIVESASQSSIDAATVTTAPVAEQAPNSSVDDRVPGSNRGPGGIVAGTDEGPASGPGPGTTIDQHPTDTSTPPTNPPTLGEPAPPSTPDPTVTTTTVQGDGGKGKGGGGGGGGGGDGGRTTTLP
jgi:hypothetical protein